MLHLIRYDFAYTCILGSLHSQFEFQSASRSQWDLEKLQAYFKNLGIIMLMQYRVSLVSELFNYASYISIFPIQL